MMLGSNYCHVGPITALIICYALTATAWILYYRLWQRHVATRLELDNHHCASCACNPPRDPLDIYKGTTTKRHI